MSLAAASKPVDLKLDRGDRRSGSLLYEQIEDHFARAIRRGDFRAKDSLPGTMVLAKELNISHLTVRRAYERLEEQGLVSRVQGKGTIVSEAGRPMLGMVSWLDDLSQQQASSISAAMLLNLTQAIENSRYTHRTILLTTPRQAMYEGDWNDHDVKLLQEAGLRGYFITGTDLPQWFVKRCKRDRVPLVGIHAMIEGLDAMIRFDASSMVQLAGEYLKQRGKTRPAVIFLDSRPGGNRAYARDIGEQLRAAGGFDGPVQTIGVRQGTAYSGRVAMQKLLEAPRRVDSVVCLDDVINQGVCWACLEAKVCVPDELLLISHANKGLTPPSLVPVARLNLDFAEAITAAHQAMMDLLNHRATIVSPLRLTPFRLLSFLTLEV